MNAPLFTVERGSADITPLAQIRAPYARSSISTLGGVERASIMLTVSLDERNAWPYGILQNTRYANFSIERDGTIENFSGSLPKFRRRKVKSLADAARAINAWIEKVQ